MCALRRYIRWIINAEIVLCVFFFFFIEYSYIDSLLRETQEQSLNTLRFPLTIVINGCSSSGITVPVIDLFFAYNEKHKHLAFELNRFILLITIIFIDKSRGKPMLKIEFFKIIISIMITLCRDFYGNKVTNKTYHLVDKFFQQNVYLI